MFCKKCGKDVTGHQFCPYCGAENENYVAGDSKPEEISQSIKLAEDIAAAKGKKTRNILIACIAAAAVVIAALFALPRVTGTGNRSYSHGVKNEYVTRGVLGYTDSLQRIVFLVDDQEIEFKGEYKEGRSTPDHSEFVLIDKEDNLLVISKTDDGYSDPRMICEDVDHITRVQNNGAYYKDPDDNYYFCNFETKAVAKIGFKDQTILFSSEGNSLAAVNADLLLAGITQLITVVVADRIHKPEYFRSLKRLIA